MSFAKSYRAAKQVEFYGTLDWSNAKRLVALGREGYGGLISWIDKNGDPKQSIKYSYKNTRLKFVSAVTIGDSDLCILGRNLAKPDEFIVLRTNKNGEIDWERRIKVPGGFGEYFLLSSEYEKIECAVIGMSNSPVGPHLFVARFGEEGGELDQFKYKLPANAVIRGASGHAEKITILGHIENGETLTGLRLTCRPGAALKIETLGSREIPLSISLFHAEDNPRSPIYGEVLVLGTEQTNYSLAKLEAKNSTILPYNYSSAMAGQLKGTSQDSSLLFLDNLAIGLTGTQLSIFAPVNFVDPPHLHAVNTFDGRPCISGALKNKTMSGLLIQTDEALKSCKTPRPRSFKANKPIPIHHQVSEAKAKAIDLKILGLELIADDLDLKATDLCKPTIEEPIELPVEDQPDDTPLSFEENVLVQSPYLNILTAGSDGTYATDGIMTRWIFGGELGDNHLPKGNVAPSGKYNRLDDFVRLYRFKYPEKLEGRSLNLLNTSPDFVDDNNYMWAYDLDDILIYIRFENTTLYDSIRAAQDPKTSPILFLGGGSSNRVVIELRGGLAYQLDLRFNRQSGAGESKYEALATNGEQASPDYKIAARGKTTMDDARVVTENIAALRIAPGNGVTLLGLKIFTYRNAISTALRLKNIESIGKFALTLNDQTANVRLSTQTPSKFNDYWSKFVDQATVKADNYIDRWSEPNSGLKHGVSKYIALSHTDPKAMATLTETLPPSADPDWVPNQMEVSYLDMLLLASMDYQNARELGLGYMDVSVAGAAEKYVYIASYVTEEDLGFTHKGKITHLSMSLPTGISDHRLPRAPKISQLSYGMSVPTANGTPYSLTDDQGYTPDGEGRYINHALRHDLYHMNDTLPFFMDQTLFDLNSESVPVFFGTSYRKDSDPTWQRPELASDADYQDPDGFNEALPTPFRDVPEDIAFTHIETKNGIAWYSPYAISIFSTASSRGTEIATDYTKLPIPNRMLPPSNFHVHLVQKEDPFALVLTTSLEQQILDNIPPGDDKTLVRVVFDYNHVQEGNYSLTRAAEADVNTYPDPVFADYVELYFRSSAPRNTRGKIAQVTELSPGKWKVQTADFPVLSTNPQSLLTPSIDASIKANFIGGAFTSGSSRFEITDVSYLGSGPGDPILTVTAPLERVSDNSSGTNVMMIEPAAAPQIDELFMAVENVGKVESWGNQSQLGARIQIAPDSGWDTAIETRTDDLGYVTTKKIRGYHETATIAAPDALVPNHYEITFDSFLLPPHPQFHAGFPTSGSSLSVSWRKGVVRIPVGDEMLDLKVERIREVSGKTVLDAIDLSGTGRAAGYTGPQNVTVNFYPGYKAYLLADPTANLLSSAVLPELGDGSRQTLMAARAADDDMPVILTEPRFASDLCIPQVLFAQEIRTPEAPERPEGGKYATPPDGQFKSTYEIALNFEKTDDAGNPRIPFGVIVYRTDIFAILSTLYTQETRQAILDASFPPSADQSFQKRWRVLLDLDVNDDLSSKLVTVDGVTTFKKHLVDDDRGDFGLPLPDLPQFVHQNGSMASKIHNAIKSILKPLTEQPILYEFVRYWEDGQRPRKTPQIVEKDGQPLTPDISKPYAELEFDIAPMAYRKKSDPLAPDLTFVDFTLDGTKHTDSVYFYAAAEMGNKMDIGPLSAFLGQVHMVNLSPPETPHFRKVLARPDGLVNNPRPLIEIEVLKALPEDQVTGLRLYRSTSGAKAKSLRNMDKVAEFPLQDLVEIDDNHLSIVDDFSDLDWPLLGSALFYRFVYTRIVPYEDANNDPKLATAVSKPSRMVLSNLNDKTNRQASSPTINRAPDRKSIASGEVLASNGETLRIITSLIDPHEGLISNYVASGLPTGLSIDSNSGEISGSLASNASSSGAAGVYSVDISATDSLGDPVSSSFTIKVLDPSIEIISITASIDKVGHNCTYYLSHQAPNGNWIRIEQIRSNESVIEFAPKRDFFVTTIDGSPLYHRFRVDVVNPSGLTNLVHNITTVNLVDL